MHALLLLMAFVFHTNGDIGDSPWSAEPYSSFPVTFNGSLYKSEDEDWIKFTLNSGYALRTSVLYGQTGSVSVELFSSCATDVSSCSLLASASANDVSSDVAELVLFYVTSRTQDLYLRVFSVLKKTGTYFFRMAVKRCVSGRRFSSRITDTVPSNWKAHCKLGSISVLDATLFRDGSSSAVCKKSGSAENKSVAAYTSEGVVYQGSILQYQELNAIIRSDRGQVLLNQNDVYARWIRTLFAAMVPSQLLPPVALNTIVYRCESAWFQPVEYFTVGKQVYFDSWTSTSLSKVVAQNFGNVCFEINLAGCTDCLQISSLSCFSTESEVLLRPYDKFVVQDAKKSGQSAGWVKLRFLSHEPCLYVPGRTLVKAVNARASVPVSHNLTELSKVAPNYAGHCAMRMDDIIFDSFSCNCSASGAINVFLDGGDYTSGLSSANLQAILAADHESLIDSTNMYSRWSKTMLAEVHHHSKFKGRAYSCSSGPYGEFTNLHDRVRVDKWLVLSSVNCCTAQSHVCVTYDLQNCSHCYNVSRARCGFDWNVILVPPYAEYQVTAVVFESTTGRLQSVALGWMSSFCGSSVTVPALWVVLALLTLKFS